MLNLSVSGISGRVGSAINSFVQENSKDYHIIGGINSKSKISDFDYFFKKSDIILDFSSPEILHIVLQKALFFSNTLLIGTTGLTVRDFDLIQKASQNIALFYSANFSVVLNLISHMLANSKFLLENFDIHITDTHHRNKKDAPSGTSKFLKQKFISNRRDHPNISQSSVRIAKFLPEHSILLANNFEMVNVTHKVLQYESIVKNVFLVVNWLRNKSTGYYDMDDFVRECF